MSAIDWIVLLGTQFFIVAYGLYKSRQSGKLEGYILGDREISWFTVGLSVMATQASAITFLSTTGQAYSDGMRFVQFYFGLPIAMVLIAWFVVPVYRSLGVYTAYEYLEGRFDLKTRTLAAILFLLQRGLATSFTIYAPALVLSVMLSWPLALCNVLIGAVVVFYTISGGSKAVSYTQKQQMLVITIGLVFSGVLLAQSIPLSFSQTLDVAAAAGRTKVITFDVDFRDRYNLWSGLLAGTFLSLGYFGTDQSQVSRYLSGRSVREIRVGLLMNGILKVPMQFGILFVGVLLFVFYQFEYKPMFFNPVDAIQSSEIQTLEESHRQIQTQISSFLRHNSTSEPDFGDRFNRMLSQQDSIEKRALALSKNLSSPSDIAKAHSKSSDYAFLSYVLNYMPIGMVGLLISVIISAAMSSASSELNALGVTSTIDIYKRYFGPDKSDKHFIWVTKLITLFWGCWAVGCTFFLDRFENLIQAVNIVGSLVYGTMLGVFVTAFFIKRVKGNHVFLALVLSEALVVGLWWGSDLAFLWYNLIGCLAVVAWGLIFSFIWEK
jgi:Na+/proline symporter